MSLSFLRPTRARVQALGSRRGALALLLAFSASLAVALGSAWDRTRRASARLDDAAEELIALTDGTPADDAGRSAIAWGYAERLRLGLESPMRLIESAARDPRLTPDERSTVSWGLLARVARGESHEIDPAVLDGIGGWENGPVPAERHVALIARVVSGAENPRAGELAVRMAYTLAAAERLVDGGAPALVANVAALVGDRELARREANHLVRSAPRDPIDELRRRRARRAFYVERPTLLVADPGVEHEAILLAAPLLDSLRASPAPAARRDSEPAGDERRAFARRLRVAGSLAPPVAPLTVTVKRLLPVLRLQAPGVNADALARAHNAEMLVAAVPANATRAERRAIGRLLVAAAVAMRTLAQTAVWFAGDSVPTAADLAASIGVSEIVFDRDVPAAWRPYFLRQLADGVADLRRVFPALTLQSLRVRFRLTSPADSALAMHDPRTRTLHLPVLTAGGTLTHELAHDLDRQIALRQEHGGYRTDFVARHAEPLPRRSGGRGADTRVASALRALTEDFADLPRPAAKLQRPAEVFATRVDWFVAQALASRGLSNGFLTAVQDEVLTGHVVHPERLRSSGRSRSLITALSGMTTVAPFAAREDQPTAGALLRWALAAPVDREVASSILRDERRAWGPAALATAPACEVSDPHARLVRMAAESRARGWVSQRSRWLAEPGRPSWARAALGQSPWNAQLAEERVRRLRDYLLAELATPNAMPAGLGAIGAPLAQRAACGI